LKPSTGELSGSETKRLVSSEKKAPGLRQTRPGSAMSCKSTEDRSRNPKKILYSVGGRVPCRFTGTPFARTAALDVADPV